MHWSLGWRSFFNNKKLTIMKKLTTILVLILLTITVMAQDEYVELAKKISKELMIQGEPDYYRQIVKQANKKFKQADEERQSSLTPNEKRREKGDYSVVSYEIHRQCKAFYKFFHMRKQTGMPKNAFEDMKAIAMDKWTEWDSTGKLIEADWTMVLLVYERQLEAYSEIF